MPRAILFFILITSCSTPKLDTEYFPPDREDDVVEVKVYLHGSYQESFVNKRIEVILEGIQVHTDTMQNRKSQFAFQLGRKLVDRELTKKGPNSSGKLNFFIRLSPLEAGTAVAVEKYAFALKVGRDTSYEYNLGLEERKKRNPIKIVSTSEDSKS